MVLTDDMQRMVRGVKLGFVATVCPDGTPNLSARGTATVWDSTRLVFADFASSQTVENLRRNPLVEINVVDSVRRKGYRFKGTAEVLGPSTTDGTVTFEEALAFYAREGVNVDDGRIKHVVVVRVETAAELIAPAYDTGKSEQAVEAKWREYYRHYWWGEPSQDS